MNPAISPDKIHHLPWRAIGCALLGLAPLLAQAKSAEEWLAEARAELTSYNFQMAEKAYAEALERSEDLGEPLRRVRYEYALALWHQTPPNAGKVAEAEKVFRGLTEAAPESVIGKMSRLNLSRIAVLRDFPGDAQRIEEGRRLLEPLLEGDPANRLTHEAALRYAEAHGMEVENEASIRKGVEFLEDWLRRFPDNPFASAAWQFLSDQYQFSLKQPVDAHRSLRNAYKLGFVNPSAAGRYLWKLARLSSENMDRPDYTVEYLKAIIRETPTSGRVWEARRWLMRIKERESAFADMEIPPMPTLGQEDARR